MKVDVLDYLRVQSIDHKVRGRSVWILCPFHDEQKASLHIDIEDGRWYCFGCGKGGGFAKFISLFEGISVKEVLRRYNGLHLGGSHFAVLNKNDEKVDLDKLWRLYQNAEVEYVPGFLQDRGISVDDMRVFGLRICLERVKFKNVNLYGWLLAPIFDWSGTFRGLTMRKISNREKVFVNSFSATRDGYFWREDMLLMRDFVVLVEGIFDVIHLMRFGINALAVFSNRVSDMQVSRLLKAGFRAVWVFFDPDSRDVSRKVAERLNLLGMASGCVYANTDPDGLNLTDLELLLGSIRNNVREIDLR
jgi:DNA primase